MGDVWPLVHAERAALILDLEALDDQSWEQPSLCGEWTVHDVVAHLVDTARTTRLGFVVGLARARFDFDRQNTRGVERERGASPRETLERLRRVALRRSTPPAPLDSRLVEEIVHGEDIPSRPLGITRAYPREGVVRALRLQARTPASFGGARETVTRARLVAVDADLSIGEGPDVRVRPCHCCWPSPAGGSRSTTSTDPGRAFLPRRSDARPPSRGGCPGRSRGRRAPRPDRSRRGRGRGRQRRCRPPAGPGGGVAVHHDLLRQAELPDGDADHLVRLAAPPPRRTGSGRAARRRRPAATAASGRSSNRRTQLGALVVLPGPEPAFVRRAPVGQQERAVRVPVAGPGTRSAGPRCSTHRWRGRPRSARGGRRRSRHRERTSPAPPGARSPG